MTKRRQARAGVPGSVWRWRGLAMLQILLGARVVFRMLRGIESERISMAPADPAEHDAEKISVIVPVLNERHRLAPCLAGLVAQGSEVGEILIVDGGSTDGTQDLVSRFAGRDSRVRLMDAAPVPPDWNGKAYGLQMGCEAADGTHPWVLTIDADTRPAPELARSLLAHARARGLHVLSAATTQHLSGPSEALIHPSMLTTLVYRFGIPGYATTDVNAVQANGQCFLTTRAALDQIGEFTIGRDSVCEDVTVARRLAAAGYEVGFFETDNLISVTMYESAGDAWQNWSRSLPMRDRYWGAAGLIGLLEVLLVQAAPPLLLMFLRLRERHQQRGNPAHSTSTEALRLHRLLTSVNISLVGVRFGTLVGTRRAYQRRPWTYWLSPITDLAVAVRLAQSATRRRHSWRGRSITRGA